MILQVLTNFVGINPFHTNPLHSTNPITHSFTFLLLQSSGFYCPISRAISIRGFVDIRGEMLVKRGQMIIKAKEENVEI